MVAVKMKLVTLYLPETYIRLLDELVSELFYPNRAEAIRVSIRTLLCEHSKFRIKTDYEVPSVEAQTAVERLVELQSRHCKKEVS
jgi:Arc/MetJ-type ribon-helix-helix transcriptional regulator